MQKMYGYSVCDTYDINEVRRCVRVQVENANQCGEWVKLIKAPQATDSRETLEIVDDYAKKQGVTITSYCKVVHGYIVFTDKELDLGK